MNQFVRFVAFPWRYVFNIWRKSAIKLKCSTLTFGLLIGTPLPLLAWYFSMVWFLEQVHSSISDRSLATAARVAFFLFAIQALFLAFSIFLKCQAKVIKIWIVIVDFFIGRVIRSVPDQRASMVGWIILPHPIINAFFWISFCSFGPKLFQNLIPSYLDPFQSQMCLIAFYCFCFQFYEFLIHSIRIFHEYTASSLSLTSMILALISIIFPSSFHFRPDFFCLLFVGCFLLLHFLIIPSCQDPQVMWSILNRFLSTISRCAGMDMNPKFLLRRFLFFPPSILGIVSFMVAHFGYTAALVAGIWFSGEFLHFRYAVIQAISMIYLTLFWLPSIIFDPSPPAWVQHLIERYQLDSYQLETPLAFGAITFCCWLITGGGKTISNSGFVGNLFGRFTNSIRDITHVKIPALHRYVYNDRSGFEVAAGWLSVRLCVTSTIVALSRSALPLSYLISILKYLLKNIFHWMASLFVFWCHTIPSNYAEPNVPDPSSSFPSSGRNFNSNSKDNNNILLRFLFGTYHSNGNSNIFSNHTCVAMPPTIPFDQFRKILFQPNFNIPSIIQIFSDYNVTRVFATHVDWRNWDSTKTFFVPPAIDFQLYDSSFWMKYLADWFILALMSIIFIGSFGPIFVRHTPKVLFTGCFFMFWIVCETTSFYNPHHSNLQNAFSNMVFATITSYFFITLVYAALKRFLWPILKQFTRFLNTPFRRFVLIYRFVSQIPIIPRQEFRKEVEPNPNY